jgi:hypothetical protein
MAYASNGMPALLTCFIDPVEHDQTIRISKDQGREFE